MRRDQRRIRLLLILLTLTSLTLITLDVRGGNSGLLDARGIVHDIVSPIESAASAVWRPIRDAFSSIVHIGRDRETAKRLAKENADLQAEVDKFENDQRDRAQLQSLANLANIYKIVPARVIAFGDVTGYENTVTIDVGSLDHISKDMTVTTGDGLVGKIISVSRSTSVVLLITDPDSTVGARLQGQYNNLGTVDGEGKNPMQFTLFDTSIVIKAGQKVVSFGSSFVPGIPIGTVTKVVNSPNGLTRDAMVTPFVSMTALDIVGVVIEQPRVDPRDTLLAPKPTPAPTVTVTAYPNASGSPHSTSSSGTGATTTTSPNPSTAPTPGTSPTPGR